MVKHLKKLAKSSVKLLTLKELKAIFKLRQKLPTKPLRPLMVSLTYIGSAGAIWILPALFMMKNKKNRFNGLLVLVGVTSDVLVNNIVTKYLFHRHRPWTYFPDEYTFNSLSLGYSFPSGHALTNTTAATILILEDTRNALWVIPLTAGISLSRLLLFAHFPSDVIAGIIDGIIVGVITYKLGYSLKEDGKLKRIEKVLEDNYFFKYSNFLFHPVEYLTKFFKVLLDS